MSEEISKAVKEAAKASQQLLAASEKVGSFLARILGEGFEHFGYAFSDWAQSYRYANLLRLIDKIDTIHAERKVLGKSIPLQARHVIPILQCASLEEHDSLQDMWAGLLANASDPGYRFQLHKLHIEILSSLDPIDVGILKKLAFLDNEESLGFGALQTINAEQISAALDLEHEDTLVSLANLFRNGLIIDAWEQTLDQLDTGYSGFRVNNPKSNFRLSHLGRNLLDVCGAI